MVNNSQKDMGEIEILSDIKESEKKAEEIIENAKMEKGAILNEAAKNSSNLLAAKEDEIKKIQEKRIMNFRDKLKLLKEEKTSEGKNAAKQIKVKAEKNIPKTVEFIIKKFEEVI
mgnify:CR=1 FL=1